MVWITSIACLLTFIAAFVSHVEAQRTSFASSAAGRQNIFGNTNTANNFVECLKGGIQASPAFPRQEQADIESIASSIISAGNTATKSKAIEQALSTALASSLAEIVITESGGEDYSKQITALNGILSNCFIQTTGVSNKQFVNRIQNLVSLLAESGVSGQSNSIEKGPYASASSGSSAYTEASASTFAQSSASSLASSSAFSSAFSSASSASAIGSLGYQLALQAATNLGIPNAASVAGAVAEALSSVGVGASSYAYASAISNAVGPLLISQGLLSQSNASDLASSFASAFAASAASASASASSSSYAQSSAAAQSQSAASAFSRAASAASSQAASQAASQAGSYGRTTTTSTSESGAQAASQAASQASSSSYAAASASAFAQSSASSLASSSAFSSAFSSASSASAVGSLGYQLALQTATSLGIPNAASVAGAVAQAVSAVGVGASSYAYASAISNAVGPLLISQGLLSQSNASALASSFASAFAASAASAFSSSGATSQSPGFYQFGTSPALSPSLPLLNLPSSVAVTRPAFVSLISPIISSGSGLSSASATSRVNSLASSVSSAIFSGQTLSADSFARLLLTHASQIQKSSPSFTADDIVIESLLEGISSLIQVINSSNGSPLSLSNAQTINTGLVSYFLG